MTKIDIFSGFLGAGKTTLIKKLIREAYAGEKLVLVENSLVLLLLKRLQKQFQNSFQFR